MLITDMVNNYYIDKSYVTTEIHEVWLAYIDDVLSIEMSGDVESLEMTNELEHCHVLKTFYNGQSLISWVYRDLFW